MKTLTITGLSVLLLALFFQCCPSATPDGPAAPAPPEEVPTTPSMRATNTPPPMPTDTPIATPTNTPQPPPPEPQHFAGHGQQASSMFRLLPRLAIFRITHDGTGHFGIWVLDDQGNNVELLVNEIGVFDGAKAVRIEREGSYILDVSADGNWTVLAEQPATPPDAPGPPLTFTGFGQDVSPMFTVTEGLATFQMTHDGSGHFGIWLLDSTGHRVDLLVNEVGMFDGSKATGIRQAGVHLLDISANGNWTIAIQQ